MWYYHPTTCRLNKPDNYAAKLSMSEWMREQVVMDSVGSTPSLHWSINSHNLKVDNEN